MRRNCLLYLGGCLACLVAAQIFVFAQEPEPIATPAPSVSPAPAVAPPATETSPTPEPEEAAPEDLIHIGDLIDVDVLGSAEFDWRGTLTPEGFLDGIGFVEEPIFALCRSERETARRIAEGYSKLLRNPQVAVRVVDRSGRPVSFLYGAVRTPQRFKINRPVRLSELIILSGGLTEKASGEIQILRSPVLSCRAQAEEEAPQLPQTAVVEAKSQNGANFINVKIADLLKGEKTANPLILNGDVVTVREAQPVYVTGGVVSPRQINVQPNLTVTRAVASAGGFVKNADRQKIVVFRREAGETRVIEVDLRKIELKETEDFELRAFDVIEVGIAGRDKRTTPPAMQAAEYSEKKSAELPLRVID